MIIIWLVLIGSKDFDRGEASDTVLAAQGLVLVGVNGSHFDNTLIMTVQVTFDV